jgi:rhodanese-related sulfurtransferase
MDEMHRWALGEQARMDDIAAACARARRAMDAAQAMKEAGAPYEAAEFVASRMEKAAACIREAIAAREPRP